MITMISTLYYSTLLIFMITSSIMDLLMKKVTNKIVYPMLIVSVFFSFVNPYFSLTEIIFSVIFITIPALVLFMKGQFGGADLKIFLILSIALGLKLSINAIGIASVFFLVTHLMKKEQSGAFVPSLFIGSFVYILDFIIKGGILNV